MAKFPPVEASGGLSTPDQQPKITDASEAAPHPYDFHVSGPRNLSAPNWRDLIRSSWLVFSFPFLIFFGSVLWGYNFFFWSKGFPSLLITYYLREMFPFEQLYFI
jgi:hypothetical protein